LSDVEKFAEFNGEILYLNLTTSSVDIARKLGPRRIQAYKKYWNAP